ncbi:MAG: hypothetical protein Nk1A_6850 [Endomicrobiia bacterium]|nr:MAG: hypothetical protein Nk1A_6850 [Endomicrobiia bacterium]
MVKDEEVKEYIKSRPEIYFKEAGRKGYVCPLCQNGEGKDGTGIEEIKGREGLYKCFKCNFSGDIFAFIAKEHNLDAKSDFPKVMEKACDIYRVSRDNKEYKVEHKIKKATELVQVEVDYTQFFEEAAKHISETDYLTNRGISKEVQEKFNVGYCKEWRHPNNPNMIPSERIIIPTSKHSYVTRAIEERKDQSKVMKTGKTHLFNPEVLSEDEPIFIVEGEIDALSIIEVGGKAVGLGGVSNTGLLETEVRKRRPSKPLILCLDNDDAGKEASKKIEGFLTKLGIPFINKSEEILTPSTNSEVEIKDPNEAFVKDREFFKTAIEKAKLETLEKPKKEREEYIENNKNRISSFICSSYEKRDAIATKFTELDNFLNGGLHTGLYILAAASGAGKTTLALQIADNIAKSEQDVLFFSGEMTGCEIFAKSVSRMSKETSKNNDKDALTMRSCMNIRNIKIKDKDGNLDKDKVKSCIERFDFLANEYLDTMQEHMIIHDGPQEIGDIKNKISTHKSITRNSPVVFIDYLQIIKAGEKMSKDRRLQVDEIVSELRIMSAQYETPIFVISSLNRYAYGRSKAGVPTDPSDEKDIQMADLKESGGVEYGSDVIMTLQAEKEDEKEDDNDDKEREMKLRIIKNRTGKRHRNNEHIELTFHTWFNYFEEKGIGGQGNNNDSKFVGGKAAR